MKIAALKSMCSKLFKTELLDFKLSFLQEGESQEYELDDDQKELNYFCVYEGAKIILSPI